jgi:CheY-like chemotaxis protein
LLLARVVGNLIRNAVGHTQAGVVRVSVRRESDGGLVFRVLDDGPGLSQDILDRLLGQEYQRLGATTRVHGLGLHIVREISDQLGAKFSIANRAGGGAEATVKFPASLCIEAIQGQAEPASAVSERPDLAGARILLAEDNLTNQLVATQMLNALNATVTVCSDGVEALEQFEAGEFDLLLVDIEMPRLSGLDVIRSVRARTDGRGRVPIVALTAYALREHRDRISGAGANGLISKPISSIDAFGRALAAHLTPAGSKQARVEMNNTAELLEDDASVVDPAIYDALCETIGGELMAELLEKVEGDLVQSRNDLPRSLAPLDLGPIRSASHILISVAGAIGATQLQARARSLNTIAHDERTPDIAAEVPRCVAEIDAAVEFAREKRAAV